MKYALLVYDSGGSCDELSVEDKRALHDADAYQAIGTGSENLLAHYRLRSPQLTTTIHSTGDGAIRTVGPAAEANNALRALFLLESDDPETVLDLAERLPAIRMGGSVEVWPLIEPRPHRRQLHKHR